MWYPSKMVTRVTSAELQQALDGDGENPVYVVDASGEPTHVVLTISKARFLLDDSLKRALEVGFEQSDRGESHAWDVEATLSEARRRRAQKSNELL
jgi:hypothetical protein